MSVQSCSSLLKEENWSGSAPVEVFYADEHVDIGPLLTAWIRLHPQAEAVMGSWGRIQYTIGMLA